MAAAYQVGSGKSSLHWVIDTLF